MTKEKGESLLPDMKSRSKSADASLHPMFRTFLKNPAHPIKAKMLFVRGLTMSRAFHLAETWPVLTAGENEFVHTKYMSYLRTAAGQKYKANRDDYVNDEAVLMQAQYPPPEAYLRLARIGLLKRFITKGDRLVSAGNGYARAATLDETTAFNVIGRALESKTDEGNGSVEAIVKIA